MELAISSIAAQTRASQTHRRTRSWRLRGAKASDESSRCGGKQLTGSHADDPVRVVPFQSSTIRTSTVEMSRRLAHRRRIYGLAAVRRSGSLRMSFPTSIRRAAECSHLYQATTRSCVSSRDRARSGGWGNRPDGVVARKPLPVPALAHPLALPSATDWSLVDKDHPAEVRDDDRPQEGDGAGQRRPGISCLDASLGSTRLLSTA